MCCSVDEIGLQEYTIKYTVKFYSWLVKPMSLERPDIPQIFEVFVI